MAELKLAKKIGSIRARIHEFIRFYSDDENYIELVIQEMSNQINCSYATLKRHLKILDQSGVIEKKRGKDLTKIKLLMSAEEILKDDFQLIGSAQNELNRFSSKCAKRSAQNELNVQLKMTQTSYYKEEIILREKEERKEKEKKEERIEAADASLASLFSAPSAEPPPPKRKPRKKPKDYDLSKCELPDWLDQELWNQFVEMRDENGKKLTVRAANISLKNLNGWAVERSSDEAHRVLEKVIQKELDAVWHPKDDFRLQKKRSEPVEFKTAAERREEENKAAAEEFERMMAEEENAKLKVINPWGGK